MERLPVRDVHESARSWLTVLLVSSTLWMPSQVRAEVDQELVDGAQVHDQRAQELYAEGDFAGAMREMQSAQALLPSSVRLYNMAACQERLDHRPEAIDLYQRFLEDETVPDERRRAARERLERLQGELSSSVQPEPAENASTVHPIDSPSEDASTGSDDQPTTESPTQQPRGRRRLPPVAFYATAGVTLASGIALAALGGVTYSKHREFLGIDPEETDQVSEAHDDGWRFVNATNAMLIVTSTAALVAVMLAIFTRWRRTGTARARLTISQIFTSSSAVGVVTQPF